MRKPPTSVEKLAVHIQVHDTILVSLLAIQLVQLPEDSADELRDALVGRLKGVFRASGTRVNTRVAKACVAELKTLVERAGKLEKGTRAGRLASRAKS